MRLWPFHRRPHDVRSQCGIWRVGELAVCVRDDWEEPDPATPAIGDVLRVAAIDEAEISGVLFRGLGFVGKPDLRWDARGFRKAVCDDKPASADFRLPAPARDAVLAIAAPALIERKRRAAA